VNVYNLMCMGLKVIGGWQNTRGWWRRQKEDRASMGRGFSEVLALIAALFLCLQARHLACIHPSSLRYCDLILRFFGWNQLASINHVFVISGGSICGLLKQSNEKKNRLCNTHSLWINHQAMRCLHWFWRIFFFPLDCWSTLLFLHLLMLNLFPVVEIERLVLLFFYFDLSLQDMLAGFYSDLIAKCSAKRPLS
jgi:hypothetical protein